MKQRHCRPMHVVVEKNNYVTTEHLVHVCRHFCRALFPITSISICRITNKCVYNSCVSGVLYFTNELNSIPCMHVEEPLHRMRQIYQFLNTLIDTVFAARSQTTQQQLISAEKHIPLDANNGSPNFCCVLLLNCPPKIPN